MVPTHAIANDPALVSNPNEFDGFRYYRARQAGGIDANRNLFVTGEYRQGTRRSRSL